MEAELSIHEDDGQINFPRVPTERDGYSTASARSSSVSTKHSTVEFHHMIPKKLEGGKWPQQAEDDHLGCIRTRLKLGHDARHEHICDQCSENVFCWHRQGPRNAGPWVRLVESGVKNDELFRSMNILVPFPDQLIQ